jgi:hypothetical protein
MRDPQELESAVQQLAQVVGTLNSDFYGIPRFSRVIQG